MFLLYLLAGLLAGIIGGMGMGGGTILIPILTIFFEQTQLTSQGINLLSFIPMAIIAIFLHFKNKLIDFKNILLLIIPACIFSVLGALLANTVETQLLTKLFGGFLILLAVFQLISVWKLEK